MDHTDLKTFVKSNALVKVLIVLFILVIALFIFEAGIVVGTHKANFAHQWQENYDRNFGGQNMFFASGPNPHGVSGKVVSVSLPTFVVAGPNQEERTVAIDDDTVIRDGSANVKADDLATGKFVVILGDPDSSGVVDARLIRIMPAQAAMNASTTNALPR